MGASCTKTQYKVLALPVQLANAPVGSESPNARRKPPRQSVQPQASKKLEVGATPRQARTTRKLLPSGIFIDASSVPTPVSQGTNNCSPQNPEVASLGAFERLSQPAKVRHSPANNSDWQPASESRDPLLTPTPRGDDQSTIRLFREAPVHGTSTNKHSVNNIGTTTTLNKKSKEDFYPLKNIGAEKLSSQVSIFVTKNENLSIGQQILEYYNSKSPRSPIDAVVFPKINQTASQHSITPSNQPSEFKSIQVPESIVVIPPVSKPKKPPVRLLRRFLVKTLNTPELPAQTALSGGTDKPKFKISRIKGNFVNRSGETQENKVAKTKTVSAAKDLRPQIKVNGLPSKPSIGLPQETQEDKPVNQDFDRFMQNQSDKSIESSNQGDNQESKKSGRLSLCDTVQNEISFRQKKGTSLRQLREEPSADPESKSKAQKKRTMISNTQTEINSKSEPKFRSNDHQTCFKAEDSFFTERSFVYESYSTENDPLALLHRMN